MRNSIATYKVVTTLEFVTYLEAESEHDALDQARELYPGDVNLIVDEIVTRLDADTEFEDR